MAEFQLHAEVLAMTLEDRIWEKASEDLYCTRQEYFASLEGWTIEAVERDGLVLAAVLRKDAMLHFTLFGETKRLPREVIRSALKPQLEQYGYVDTRTPKIDARQHRFNKTLGFKPVGQDEFNVLYRLNAEDCRA